MTINSGKVITQYRYARSSGAFAVSTNNGAIVYASEKAAIHGWQSLVQLHNPGKVEFLPEVDFNDLLAKVFDGNHNNANEIIEDIERSADLTSLFDELPPIEDLLDSEDEAPIIKLINGVFGDALRKKASDVHIEQMDTEITIRLRIDGILQTVLVLPRTLGAMLLSRVKVMAQLDIAEKRLPQDGRITVRVAGKDVDIRVSTLPGIHGERAVMRILDKSKGIKNLGNQDMPDAVATAIRRIIAKPNGILLVTGPTGSGKTTTLYSALSELNDRTRNILTIEDPVEYAIPGIGQTQVNSKTGMTFAKGLRSILRQDPDVVMIGEIRDVETAQIAVQASLTGHLVLSTLHTNSSLGALTRLRDMGIESFLLASSIKGVIAQRLVRTLCTHCKVYRHPSKPEAQWLLQNMISRDKDDLDDSFLLASPEGCELCHGTGYIGRKALYEVVQVDRELERLIHEKASEHEMSQLAFSRGDQETLSQSGARLIIRGETSMEEVLRAVSNE